MFRRMILLVVAIPLALAGRGEALEADEVNNAEFMAIAAPAAKANPFVVKAQTLLGRRSISPGVIDGLDGENFRKAIAQFRRQNGLEENKELDQALWAALSDDPARDIVRSYTITDKDASYDFADEIPADYALQAQMNRLAYTSSVEMFAERFHMSENLLKQLNPKATFKAGEKILVVHVRRPKQLEPVQELVANKTIGMLVAYGHDKRILASYPATIGSERTPSPDGEHTITRIATNPTYHCDSEKNFQQGANVQKLTLPAGPNNPVGSVWIALSKPTYGIHGTPEPAKVSKSSSHGCIRLTNWDAEELAAMVKPGLVVRFTD